MKAEIGNLKMEKIKISPDLFCHVIWQDLLTLIRDPKNRYGQKSAQKHPILSLYLTRIIFHQVYGQ